MDWKSEAEQLKFDENKSWGEITDTIKPKYFPDMTTYKAYEKIRGYIRKTDKYKELNNKSVTDKVKISYKNGESTFEGKIIELMAGEPITPEILLKAYNIDNKKFEITSYTANIWQSQVKGGKKLDMYQSKITVKPKKSDNISFDDISKYFDTKQWEEIELPEPKQYDENGETLEIDIADLHSGLLAWREETGKDYDLKIMHNRFITNMIDIKKRCQNRKFKKIIIANLGDIIHIDNNKGTTTKGTEQCYDGRVEKIVKVTCDMYIAIIKLFSEIAPIEFINVKGNHDEVLSFMFAFALEKAFTENKNITFDISPNPQKARLIGKSLVGFEHGIENKQRQGDWLVNDYRELFGKSMYAEVHSGHLHSQTTEEKTTGVIVKRLPAICNQSAWEHINGFRAYKAIICYVWNDELLLRETWFNYV